MTRVTFDSRPMFVTMVLLFGVGCRVGDSGRDSTKLRHAEAGPVLRVTILGSPSDARVAPAREAIAHWSSEFRRLGRRVQFDSGTIRDDSVPDEMLRAANGEAVLGGGPATDRVLARLADVPADIVIALSHTDLISFSSPWRSGSKGLVGVRRGYAPAHGEGRTIDQGALALNGFGGATTQCMVIQCQNPTLLFPLRFPTRPT